MCSKSRTPTTSSQYASALGIQGRRKQFKSGQAITKVGGPGVLPRKILKKYCLLAHFGVILRAYQQDLKTDFIFLNDTFGSLVD